MKKIFVLLAIILLVGSWSACGTSGSASPSASKPAAPAASPAASTSAAPAKTVNLAGGCGASSSGTYAYGVAFADIVNKFVPGVKMTVVESAGTVDNARRLAEGTFDMGLILSASSAWDLYTGTGEQAGKTPFKDVRVFNLREHSVMRIYVRKDSGIKTYSDLAGKALNPGLPGSSGEVRFRALADSIGVPINLVQATLADALKAIEANKVVGIVKSGPMGSFDSGMKELHFNTPMTVVGFTKEQADKALAKVPENFGSTTKITELPEITPSNPVMEWYSSAGTSASTKMSEDLGYRIAKAIYENWGTSMKAAYPATAGLDPFADYFSKIQESRAVPFHAGVIKYCVEKGIKVPAYLIPPEYKGNR